MTSGARMWTAPLAAALLLVGVAGCTRRPEIAQVRPDVLLVVVDTLRADRLPVYGYPHGRTPTIDRLAEESVVFERAVAASAATLPSHASIFTSRWVRQHSIGHSNGATVLAGETTLAERFRSAGYATGAFVSNVMLNRFTGLGRGFDVYDDELPVPERNRPEYFERPARETTRSAIRWLRREKDRPVFLLVHYQDPHGPYTPPVHLRNVTVPAPPGEPRLPVNETQSGHEGIPAYQELPGLDRPSQYESLYIGEIMFMDRWLGQLLRAFDQHRPAAGHVVLFTSDHGESLGEEDHWFEHGHTSTPDVAHIPFLLKAPGLEPQRVQEAVSHVDVLPTLLELAGLPVPDGLAGIALGPSLRDGKPVSDRILFCDLGAETAVYRDDGFVRIRFPSIGAGDRGAFDEASLGRYEWSGEGWDERTGALEIGDETRAYFSTLTARRPVDGAPVPADRLRALGYLDPEGE